VLQGSFTTRLTLIFESTFHTQSGIGN